MTADGPSQGFVDARTALRDNAKWVLAGIGGLLAVVLGGATISQFGALDPLGPDAWRFWLGALAGAFGIGLCLGPIDRALALLRIDVVSTDVFLKDPGGLPSQALQLIDDKLGQTLNPRSVRAYLVRYQTAEDTTQKSEDQAKINDAEAIVDQMFDKVTEIRQAMTTELVRLQFTALMASLRKRTPITLFLFLVVAWAANPPKDDDVLLSKPLVVNIASDADTAWLLKSLIPNPACYAPTVRVIVFAEQAHGDQAGVLIPPRPGLYCPAVRVELLDGHVRLAGSGA